jgi:drug/metabolite transporter (DMT)-like permease
VLAALLFGENLSALGVVGLVLGVLGLGLLEVPEEVLVQGPAALAASAGAGGSVFQSGEFYMLLAAQSMALGTVMVRWVAGQLGGSMRHMQHAQCACPA